MERPAKRAERICRQSTQTNRARWAKSPTLGDLSRSARGPSRTTPKGSGPRTRIGEPKALARGDAAIRASVDRESFSATSGEIKAEKSPLLSKCHVAPG